MPKGYSRALARAVAKPAPNVTTVQTQPTVEEPTGTIAVTIPVIEKVKEPTV
jgi:hypothetical protein